MSGVKPPQKGSVLSNLDSSADAPSPPASPPNQDRSASPDEKSLLLESKEAVGDLSVATKDAEPETKKRKRSQRACIRCRGQKLKCDGVFPCARCLKLKLVCKEPSEANAATPTSNRTGIDDRDSKGNTASYASSASTRPHSQASVQLAASGLPSHANLSYASSLPDGVLGDCSRSSNHISAAVHHRGIPQPHPSDRFGYSLPDAVRRIEKLERTVSRLVERVEGHSGTFERNSASTLPRPSSSRWVATPQKSDRKRARADSLDDSDGEVDELQDGVSEASIPLQSLSQQGRRGSRDVLSVADDRSGPTRASNEPPAPYYAIAGAAPTTTSLSHGNGSRQLTAQTPIDAGFITLEMAQMLLEVFFTYCHVFAPFLELDDKASVAVLSASEPFLLSVLLTIGSLYQDLHGKGDSALRSDIHGGLASYAIHQLGSQLCAPDPTIGSVQGILLIAYWPQAFPGSPDEKLLSGYANTLLQSVSRRYQLGALNGDRTALNLSHRIPSLWTSLRAFESLAAIDLGMGMELTDYDLAMSKAPRSPRSSIPTPYIARAVPVIKELQMWLGEISSNAPLSQVELPPPAARSNFTHDWDRFKYLQTQLFDVEKRWLASESDCSRLERIVGLVDRWTLQIYLAAVALKSVELGRPPNTHGPDRSAGYDMRYEEDSARFVAAYRHDIRQACQVLMDIFTDPEISGALLYAPGYLLRRFGQAAVCSALLIDFHDAELTRSAQELIYLCSKRFDQLGQLDPSPFAANLSWFVKSSYDKVGGRSSRDERDGVKETSAPSSVTALECRRWLGGDLFPIYFGAGLAMDSSAGLSNGTF